MSKNEQTYILAITIIEGRHYIWQNMNSAVILKVGNKRRCTAVQKNSDNPFYNEYFTFEFTCTHEKFLENNIILTVVRPKSWCRGRRTLGTIKLDVETVMNQKNSQFYHKWAGLASTKKDLAPTGFLKLDITILSKGQSPKLPLNVFNDDIEGNLLTTCGTTLERQRVKFIFKIYHCEHFSVKSNQFTDLEMDNLKPCTYVKISFAGSTVSTTVKKGTQTPIFNEKLIITDLFPPLYQRVKLEICTNNKKITEAVQYLHLKQISCNAIEGFPPTFGPTYLYFYGNDGYAGRLLMSIKTEFFDDTLKNLGLERKEQRVQHHIKALPEELLFSNEETFLFATIFEANCINKKYSAKSLSFRLTFGNVTYELSEHAYPLNVTVGKKPLKNDNFYYLNYGQEKPCLRIRSIWPDYRKRLFHSNMLEKIANNLKYRLEEIENMLLKHSHYNSESVGEKLKEASEFLLTAIETYLDILETSYNFDYGSLLDRERTKLCKKTMKDILEKLLFLQTNKSKKFVYRNLEDFHSKIESLIEDAQPCWPDIYLWITCLNKKIGHLRIPARNIIFSKIPEEIGKNCGKVIPLIFLIEGKQEIICKIDILLWLGLEKEKDSCMQMLPTGFKYEGKLLVAIESHIFESKAYIFEGSIEPGFDDSGLADPFVQCSLGTEMKQTLVKYKVCVPIWDQTLNFNNLVFHGGKDYLKMYPPSFLVQMFDKDPFSKEFIGRTIIKPEITFLDESEQPIKLKFYFLQKNGETFGRILAAFYLTEIPSLNENQQKVEKTAVIPIPQHIKPLIEPYRIEVVFWGVRNLRKIHLIRINRPKIIVFFENNSIESQVINNARKFANFTENICSLDVNIPNQNVYPGIVRLKLYDSRNFGMYVFAGICLSETTPFLFKLMTKEERLSLINGIYSQSSIQKMKQNNNSGSETVVEVEPIDIKERRFHNKFSCWLKFRYFVRLILGYKSEENTKKIKNANAMLKEDEENEEDESDFDWWTKFYASIEKGRTNQTLQFVQNTLKIYPSELENQPEFNGFSDMLTTFEIFRGKQTGDEVIDEQFITACFKGLIKIYKWPPEDHEEDKYVTPQGSLVKDGVFSSFPANTIKNYILRVYCVRGCNLRPKDRSGKSDPYIEIQLGDKLVSDRENYIPREVNPVFGRCFEFYSSFPQNTSLTIRLKDYDFASKDDLIGETKIDLENRFYTKHRAKCGLAETYRTKGYCKWRDQRIPSKILSITCQKWGLDDPVYLEKSVTINSKEFRPKSFKPISKDIDKEVLALEALRNWHQMPFVGFKFVPEHVETRSLFTPDKPGLEQGKLQLWIDIFPQLDYPVSPKVDITPKKPIAYELRVIIWNTEDVVLQEDDIFTGERKSDIYVKGWLDDPLKPQYTDIHYRSLTGEGNFNWRFIFKFHYLITENKMLIKKKESLFAREETTFKFPCIVKLSVWDNDTFSADDFLGSLELELSKMPKGAPSSKQCDISIMDSKMKNKINLFKIGRTKGWWPFQAKCDAGQTLKLAGKLEAEFELFTMEEAEKRVAGEGRQGPEPLAPPHRPDTSYSWFRGLHKSCKYVVCIRWRKQICCSLLMVFLVIFVVLAVYAFPGAVVQKLLAESFYINSH